VGKSQRHFELSADDFSLTLDSSRNLPDAEALPGHDPQVTRFHVALCYHRRTGDVESDVVELEPCSNHGA
jgi:hypothetical protein